MRRKPLRDLTDEELRLAISQKMGLRFLMPLAVERLEADPLVAGDMYEGALLGVVLSQNCWQNTALGALRWGAWRRAPRSGTKTPLPKSGQQRRPEARFEEVATEEPSLEPGPALGGGLLF